MEVIIPFIHEIDDQRVYLLSKNLLPQLMQHHSAAAEIWEMEIKLNIIRQQPGYLRYDPSSSSQIIFLAASRQILKV